jgi:4a-hydroxytetrahydrobiopterin dehydratase
MQSPEAFMHTVPSGWRVVDDHHLEKEFTFPNFVDALAFVNRIGTAAEELEHHPDIYLTWGKVRVQTFTHDTNGLTGKDFALAEKIEASL